MTQAGARTRRRPSRFGLPRPRRRRVPAAAACGARRRSLSSATAAATSAFGLRPGLFLGLAARGLPRARAAALFVLGAAVASSAARGAPRPRGPSARARGRALRSRRWTARAAPCRPRCDRCWRGGGAAPWARPADRRGGDGGFGVTDRRRSGGAGSGLSPAGRRALLASRRQRSWSGRGRNSDARCPARCRALQVSVFFGADAQRLVVTRSSYRSFRIRPAASSSSATAASVARSSGRAAPIPVERNHALQDALPAAPASTAACITFVPPECQIQFVGEKSVSRDCSLGPYGRRKPRLLILRTPSSAASAAWSRQAPCPPASRLDLGRRRDNLAGLAGQGQHAEQPMASSAVDHARRDRAATVTWP